MDQQNLIVAKKMKASKTKFESVLGAYYEKATDMQIFVESVMPGMLQTSGYATALVQSLYAGSMTAEELNAFVNRRIQWQKDRLRRITAGELKVTVIIDEAALHRVVGNREIMREQLAHVESLIDQPGLEILVWPLNKGALLFTFCPGVYFMTFGNQRQPVVYVEHNFTGIDTSELVDDKEAVAYYAKAFSQVTEQARRFVPDPKAFIAQINHAEYGAPR